MLYHFSCEYIVLISTYIEPQNKSDNNSVVDVEDDTSGRRHQLIIVEGAW